MDLLRLSAASALVTWFYFHSRKVRGDTAVLLVVFLLAGVFVLLYTSTVSSPAGHSLIASIAHATVLVTTHIVTALADKHANCQRVKFVKFGVLVILTKV
ncbi:hypothetical protein DFH07DRAFT_962030 [Mycena maculata]|uniref:Uncharacterized protein n=1 Tax=Mycena maculata TaxID=230809 RepID=A0AAD7N6J6_9AGAR|nr:hypothetical protein DFH07DRAFT_962030 [Mycena maculata]